MANVNIDMQKLSEAFDNVKSSAKQTTTSKSRRCLKTEEPRSRWFCLTTYIPFDEVVKYLGYCTYVKHWSAILHDKDVQEDGTPKEPHTHVLLYTYNAKTSSAIRKKFNNLALEVLKEGEEPQNTLVQICNEPLGMYRYQLHLDDKDKHQYLEEERICDDISYWLDLERSDGGSDNIAVEIYDSIVHGMSSRELLVRYGCEYAHNVGRYKELVVDGFRETHSAKPLFDELYDSMIYDLVESCGFICEQSKKDFFKLREYVNKKLEIATTYANALKE